jgi:hypothetical protein
MIPTQLKIRVLTLDVAQIGIGLRLSFLRFATARNSEIGCFLTRNLNVLHFIFLTYKARIGKHPLPDSLEGLEKPRLLAC